MQYRAHSAYNPSLSLASQAYCEVSGSSGTYIAQDPQECWRLLRFSSKCPSPWVNLAGVQGSEASPTWLSKLAAVRAGWRL